MKLAYALQAGTGRRDRLTPGKAIPKLDTYQRRLTEMETWLTANRPALAAFTRGAGCRLPDAACVLRLMVSNSKNAECDLTAGQLAAKSLLSDATVKRCLKALSDAGCYVQVLPGRSAGRHGGAGRGAVRRLTMLGVELQVPQVPQDDLMRRVAHCLTLTMLGVELQVPQDDHRPAPDRTPDLHPQQEMTVHFSLNDGAPECTPLRDLSPENKNPPADVSHNADPVPAEGVGGDDETNSTTTTTTTPTLAPVVPLLHRRPAPPAPDRRAFPSIAAWCAAMADHARATAAPAGSMIEPAPARCSDTEGPSTQHPMPADVLLQHIAAAAGRRYAELEHTEGRAHSPRGLAAWATTQHLETLQALCRTHDHWRRWVLYAQVDTLAQALRYWHADRTLHMATAGRLDTEANAQQRHAGAG